MSDFEKGLEAARVAVAAEQLDWAHSDQAWAACANICARLGKLRECCTATNPDQCVRVKGHAGRHLAGMAHGYEWGG